MRFPANWSMELLLMLALFASIIVTIFAIGEPQGDRTRITLERSEVTWIGERATPVLAPALADETGLGR